MILEETYLNIYAPSVQSTFVLFMYLYTKSLVMHIILFSYAIKFLVLHSICLVLDTNIIVLLTIAKYPVLHIFDKTPIQYINAGLVYHCFP